MKNNPFPVIIPCHRVVRSDGDVGGYAFGIDIKKNLLLNEGIKTDKNKKKTEKLSSNSNIIEIKEFFNKKNLA